MSEERAKSDVVQALESVEESIELFLTVLEVPISLGDSPTPMLPELQIGIILGLRAAYSMVIQEINEALAEANFSKGASDAK